jgi:MFS family permease
VGAFIVCIGCLIFSLAKTLLFALLGRVLMGGGAAFAFVGCLNIISIWFPARRFALMAAIVETAGMLGAIIGNFWLANCIEKIGWRDCLIFAGIFAGILSFFLVMVVRNGPRKKLSSAIVARTSLRAGLKKTIRNPVVWLNGVYSGLMFGIVTVFIALWAIPFFEFVHHVDLVQATMTASALYVGVAIGGPILGWLDSKKNWRKRMMISNAFCASILLLVVVFGTQLSLITIGVLLLLTGMCASSYVLTFAIANEIATADNRATCIGFTNMLCVIFAPILQPFIGFLITHLKNMHDYFQWSMSVVPMLLLVAAAIGFFLPERNR